MHKPRLFVHVGLPKCGSTSIQLRLASNRTALLERGMFYPLMPPNEGGQQPVGHMRLATSMQRPGGISPLLADVLRKFAESGARDLCISSESFVARTDTLRVESVGNHLSGFGTRLIAFYRRHDEWIVSRFKQAVFGRDYTGSMAQFVANPPAAYVGMVEFDIADRLDRLAKLFGAGDIRVVDLAANGGDAVAEMGRFIGVPLESWQSDPTIMAESNALKVEEGAANVSLGNLDTLYLRDVNRLEPDAELRNAILVALLRTAGEEPPTRLMRKPMAERLRATFERVNRPLFDRYGLEPHGPSKPARGPFRAELEAHERNAITSRILNAMESIQRDAAGRLLAKL